jgi:carbon monoxide dehydrogenase subunit G
MKIESRIGKIQAPQARVYETVSDFSRIGSMLPADKISDIKADRDSCSFKIENMGNFGMQIIERDPVKTVKIGSSAQVPFKFTMWIQLKELSENETAVKVTLDADMNPMVAMVAKGPLTNFMETLVARLEQIR